MPRRLGPGKTGAILNILAIASVIFFVPWLVGLSFLDALVVIPFACLSVFFVAILIPDSFAGAQARVELESLIAGGVPEKTIVGGRTLAVVLCGWGCGMGILPASLGTVNALHWHGRAILPPVLIILDAAGVSLALSGLVAVIGVIVSLRASSPRAAQRTLRFTLMGTMLAAIFGVRLLPNSWMEVLESRATTEGLTKISAGASLTLAIVACLLFSTIRLKPNDRQFPHPEKPDSPG